MRCKICSTEFPSARAVGDHHKNDHPVEYRKRQREKARRAAETAGGGGDEPVRELDVEASAIDAAVTAIAAYELTPAARVRVVNYLAMRYDAGGTS